MTGGAGLTELVDAMDFCDSRIAGYQALLRDLLVVAQCSDPGYSAHVSARLALVDESIVWAERARVLERVVDAVMVVEQQCRRGEQP